ncbi:uncharacterized protein METZ01_LOCUS246780, partial [marine metagenome]
AGSRSPGATRCQAGCPGRCQPQLRPRTGTGTRSVQQGHAHRRRCGRSAGLRRETRTEVPGKV